MELMDIVDEENQVIGRATRDDIYANKHPHRIVHVLISDSRDRLALQLVAKNKPPYAGHWGTSVGGHVQAGESYEEAAKRELLEEFGICVDFEHFADVKHISPLGQTKFMKIFRAFCDEPLAIDTRETERIEYFSMDEIKRKRVSGEKFAPELCQIIDDCL